MKRLNQKEREAFAAVDRNTYPQDMPCAVCGARWMQHKGMLCSSSPGGVFFLDMGTYIEPIPIAPRFEGESFFVPDLAWQNQNPDFDVV